MVCKNCGEVMSGDGYKEYLHCPYADSGFDNAPEPDANPIFCEDLEEENENNT